MAEASPVTPAPSPTDEQPSCSSASGNGSGSGSTPQKVKVLIIGAGMAGLAAANHLLQNGCEDFRIVEARGRIGGRIVAIPLSDTQRIELGANWIHGVLGNPIFELAVQHGLASVVNIPKIHKVLATTEDGRQIPFSIVQEIYRAYVIFLRRCDEYFLSHYVPPPDIVSVGEHVNYEIEIFLSSVEDPKEKHIKRMMFNCLLKRETCITGCHNMNEIDLLELGSYTELQGGNIVLPSGYSSILRPMIANLPEEAIITNCPVKKIHWKRKRTPTGLDTVDEDSEEEESDDSEKTVTEMPIPGSTAAAATAAAEAATATAEAATAEPKGPELGGASVESKTSSISSCDFPDYPVRVECEDGRVIHAAHVICTIPLGVLKKEHKMLFSPELPYYKQESIEDLMFGTVDKIYLEYNRPFLNAEISEIMLLWDDDKYEMNTTSAERETEEYLSKHWFKKIYSFTKLTDTLLLCWVSGREAEYMETLPTEVVAQKCTEILRNFLMDPYVPNPKRCICTTWRAQEYTAGSYTSVPVGSTQEDIENLAQSLYATPHSMKPVVLFAGEHTHSNFYSTVHGAYLSGRTAAQEILDSEEPDEIIMEPDGPDLSAWIRGISLED